MSDALEIPSLALVLVQGPDPAQRAALCARWFAADEVLRPDPADPAALEAALNERLGQGLLTAVDAPLTREAQVNPLLIQARDHLVRAVVLSLEPDPEACAARTGRRPKAIREELRQQTQLDRDLAKRRTVLAVRSLPDPEALELLRRPLSCDRRDQDGPFDVIGDVHGCHDELRELLERLGYDEAGQHPAGRRLVFVGDLCDRGPGVLPVLELAMDLVERGRALCVLGNHDDKLLRWLDGRKIKVSRGLRVTVDALEALPPDAQEAFRQRLAGFVRGLPVHLVLDEGRLVVAHAGLKERMIGREGSRVRAFALYGDTTGKSDEHGYPVRRDWAASYRGPARIVYGHTPVERAEWRHGTANVDQGCCFGGALTAVRYPEGEFVGVPARRVYWDRKGGA